MEFKVDKAVLLLERTPTILNSFLKGLPSEWASYNEGQDTWSPFDIIGHLIQGEKTDWITRSKIILSDADKKEFKPFDRFAQFENSKGKSLDELLTEFEKLRTENLAEIKKMDLSDNNLTLEANHPGLGKVTLKQLLSTWVTHDLTHIAQIARVIAKQYKDQVGPWVEYIGILNR